MMYSKRHLPDMEQWSQSSGSNVIPRRALLGLAGLRPHTRGVLGSEEQASRKILGRRVSFLLGVQGYFAHKKTPTP